jgi:hypothetical protein
MAEAKEQLKKTKKRIAKPRGAKAVPCKKRAVKAEQAPASDPAEKKAGKPGWLRRKRQGECDGAKAMLDCANQALAAMSVGIVDKFAQQANGGNAISAKFLFDLVTTKKVTGRSKSKKLPMIIDGLVREAEAQAAKTPGSQTESNE